MIAVCGLCGRELEVMPFEQDTSFEDLCLACLHGITSVDVLSPKEKQNLLQAAEIAVAMMEVK